MDRLFQIYKRLLEIHIASKTTGTQFHKDTEKAYEVLFDVFHTTSEIKQDLGQEPTCDAEDCGQEAYDLIEEAKTMIYGMVGSNKDIGMDNLLRGHAEDLVNLCGTFNQYTDAQEEEEEKEEENEPMLVIKGSIGTMKTSPF